MQDPATLSKRQLLQLVGEKDNELATKDSELATHTRTIAQQSDVIRQLEAKIDAKEKAYLKLWQKRFAAKSERYIADPDQLRMDFGDTPESADAVAGLADAIEEADLVSAHRRKKRKKRDESSAHRNDLDVWAYVNDVLKRLLAGETDYEPMLPWNWATANPESIREFRNEERRERTEQKQFKRDQRRAKKARQKKLDSRRK